MIDKCTFYQNHVCNEHVINESAVPSEFFFSLGLYFLAH